MTANSSKDPPIEAGGAQTGRGRLGKIARLPEGLRRQVNQMLAECRTYDAIADWLNQQPEAQAVCREWFGGRPITKGSVHHWYYRGYRRWKEQRWRENHGSAAMGGEEGAERDGLDSSEEFRSEMGLGSESYERVRVSSSKVERFFRAWWESCKRVRAGSSCSEDSGAEEAGLPDESYEPVRVSSIERRRVRSAAHAPFDLVRPRSTSFDLVRPRSTRFGQFGRFSGG